jgi:tRNA modification GTPase
MGFLLFDAGPASKKTLTSALAAHEHGSAMQDTFVAQSTPQGTSALAVVRVSGPLCESIALGFHVAQGHGGTLHPRHAYYGALRDGRGELIDEVVWIYYAKGSSYTGDAMLEIMPHGNPIICQALIEHLCALGCRLAEAGEFTQRAYLNGKLKFSQISGVLEVIHAQTDRALSAARKRLTGESGRIVRGLVQDLTSLRAEIEAYIDFPEDELPPQNVQSALLRLDSCLRHLERLHASSEHYRLLQDGIHTLIVGAPNAGKSSLLNLLLGQNRALVSPIAGTTRDYLIERIHVGGLLVNLYDTAGLNLHPDSDLEAQGIQHTLELLDLAQFFLVVIDSTRNPEPLPSALLERIHARNALVIENKTDLDGACSHPEFLPEIPHLPLSAVTGEHLKEFCDRWQSLMEDTLDLHREEDVMFDHRERSFIHQSIIELKDARAKLSVDSEIELVAFHLLRACEELNKVESPIDHEAVLDQLFKRFCIGK